MITSEEKELRSLFDQPEICSKCEGHGFCCRRNACNCHPLDFDNDVAKMEKALETGKYAIDFARKTADAFIYKGEYLTLDTDHIIQTDREALYMRPRNINRPIVDIVHETEDVDEGPCVLWSYEKGCELEYDERPMFGRTTIPSKNPKKCFNYYDVLGGLEGIKDGQTIKLCDVWKPYTKELFRLAQRFFDENWHWYKQLKINLKEENIG